MDQQILEVGDLLVFAAHSGDVTPNPFSGLFALVTKHAVPPLPIFRIVFDGGPWHMSALHILQQ